MSGSSWRRVSRRGILREAGATAGLAAGAAALAQWDTAGALFEDAIEANARMGSRPWVVWVEGAYLRMLLSSGRAEDRQKATDRLPRVRQLSRELGMDWIVGQSEALLTYPPA